MVNDEEVKLRVRRVSTANGLPSLHSPKPDFDVEIGPYLVNTHSTNRPSLSLQDFFPRSDIDDKLFDQCWTWYRRYLDATIKRDWKTIFSPIIKGLDPDYPREATIIQPQLALVYKVIEAITQAISNRNDVSLKTIIHDLDKNGLLRDEDDDGPIEKGLSQFQCQKVQMVWVLVGIITMLYEPKRKPYSQKLQLQQPASNRRAKGMRRVRDLSSSQQSVESCRDPLHSVLGQFGNLIPRVENVAKLEIEWVNTMNLHLQLDKRKKVLRLYRFPALCFLLWNEIDENFMQRLFEDHRKSLVEEDEHTEHTFSEYLREIILSYRLLFGIDKKSRKAFKKELQRWTRYEDQSTPSQSREHSRAISLGQSLNHYPTIDIDAGGRMKENDSNCQFQRLDQDPLLNILTTTENVSQSQHRHLTPAQHVLTKLLTQLYGEEKSTQYDLEDFPFLGRRLAELQRFSLIQKPNDWKSLFWVDQRDMQNFWTSLIAWALLIIGGGTLLLQFFQLVFQILGTFWSKS